MYCKYVIFAFLAVVLQNADAIWDPPRIYPTDSELTVDADADVTLHCEGSRPVRWELPSLPLHIPREETSVINMSVTNSTPDKEYPYGIELSLLHATYQDIGFYVCIFNDSYVEFKEENVDELVNSGIAAAIYLYVQDDENLYIPPAYVISANQLDEVIIPCRPTFPDVTVTLYKDEQEIDANFNPKIGFSFYANDITDSGMYECIFHNKKTDTNESAIVNLFVTTRTTSVAQPEITQEGSNSGHAIEGKNLVLHCRVNLTVLGVLFKLSWSTPNITASTRSIQSETKQRQINNVLHGESTLTVTNVSKFDEGHYKCTVTDNSGNTNYVARYITVVSPDTSFINLTEPTGRTVMEAKSGDRYIQWNVKIKAFPAPKLIWYDPKGHEISASWGKPNAHYEIRNTQESSLFKINNVDISDAGIYQLRAMTIATEAAINITLKVKVKPETYFAESNTRYYTVNEIAIIECYVTGYPLPSVQWKFQPCPHYPECQKDIITLPLDSYTTQHSSTYIMTSVLRMNATTPGYLYCIGTNELGTRNMTENFFITDVPDGFAVWPTPPHQLYRESKVEVAVGDTLTLICGASIFNYTDDLSWVYIYNEENFFLEPDYEKTISKNYTRFSYRTQLVFNSMKKNQSGEYGCRANKIKSESLYDAAYISVRVNDLAAPYIHTTNLNNSDIKINLGVPLSLYCEASGVPTPKIMWFKDDVEINPLFNDTKISITEDGQLLKLRYVELQDEGLYSCVAENKVQVDQRTSRVMLRNKPGLHYAITASLVFVAILFILCIVYLSIKVKKEKNLRKELAQIGLAHFEDGNMESINPELTVDEQAELLPYDRKWEFPRDKLKLGKQLGSGAFGVVLKAEAQGICEGEDSTTVAVKMVKRTADPAFIKALASELKVMVHLGKHLNVVNLLGACTKNVAKRELLVIVEFCRYGNIHNFLLRHRNAFIDQIDRETGRLDPTIGEEILQRTSSMSSCDFTMYGSATATATGDSDNSGYLPPISGGPNTATTAVTLLSVTPTGEEPLMSNNSVQPEWRSNYRGDYREHNVKPVCTQDLLCWAFQIARGMEYLASRKVLHGDLAARNILLAEDNVVKICDFGLARSMYKDDNYQKKGEGPLPVKWMAIESIRDRVFSTQSDIWSFGVTMWELFSLARTPYPGMEANEKLYLRLVEGYRMERPQFANEAIYQTMLDCWNATPTSRPSFTDLTASLGSMLEDTVRVHYVDLNEPYQSMNSAVRETGGDYLAMMSSPDITLLQAPISAPNYVNSPPIADIEGADYLCMSPSKPKEEGKEANSGFQFPSPNSRSKTDRSHMELTPMLTNASDSETEPNSPALCRIQKDSSNSVANPAYHKLFDKTWVGNGNNPTSNYVNVSPNNNFVVK